MEAEETKVTDAPVEIKISNGVWQLIIKGVKTYENSDFSAFSGYLLAHAAEIEAEATK